MSKDAESKPCEIGIEQLLTRICKSLGGAEGKVAYMGKISHTYIVISDTVQIRRVPFAQKGKYTSIKFSKIWLDQQQDSTDCREIWRYFNDPHLLR